MDAATVVELTDWRRAVAELYAQVRRAGDGEHGWELWRAGRERLYREHPQSPVPAPERAAFRFPCFPHDPGLRVLAALNPAPPRHRDGDDDVPGMTSVGELRFAIAGREHRLTAYWLDGYAGGLFVPFQDTTSGRTTYGGGRYVLDTAKGADLGREGDRIVLDFNCAFAPSCAHDPRWRCPLAPPESRLDVAIEAGERAPS